MTVEDLKLIFYTLPENVKDNLLFQEIKKQFFDAMNDEICKKAEISINETILDDSLDDVDDFYILEEEDPILIEFKYLRK